MTIQARRELRRRPTTRRIGEDDCVLDQVRLIMGFHHHALSGRIARAILGRYQLGTRISDHHQTRNSTAAEPSIKGARATGRGEWGAPIQFML